MKNIFFVFLLANSFSLLQAQDTLVLRNNTKVPVLLIEIKPETVRYKKVDNLEGPDYTTYKSEIRYIIFKNGLKETVDTLASGRRAQGVSSSAGTGPVNVQMYGKGVSDAKLFYKHSCGEVGTGVASFLFSIVGLIPAIIISATPPREKNLNYPDEELWKNKDYKAGYKRQAKKIKQKKVWMGFGIGLVTGIVVTIMLSPK